IYFTTEDTESTEAHNNRGSNFLPDVERDALVSRLPLAVGRTANSQRPTANEQMISFNNVSKQHGKQVLFVDASFQLNPGEKVGLVGPNGSGKTTLFRMLVGEQW